MKYIYILESPDGPIYYTNANLCATEGLEATENGVFALNGTVNNDVSKIASALKAGATVEEWYPPSQAEPHDLVRLRRAEINSASRK